MDQGHQTGIDSFSEQWKASISACCSALEPNDRIQVSASKTFDDILRLFPKFKDASLPQVALQEFALLSRALEELKEFIEFLFHEAKLTTDDSMLWSSIALIIQLSKSEDGVAPRVPRMLRNICHKIDALNRYLDKSSIVFPQIREICFEIAHSLLLFIFAVIKFIREDREYSSSASSVWEPLDQQFTTFISEIQEAVSRLEMLSKTSGLDDLTQLQSALAISRTQTGQLTHRSSDEMANLPCFIYPTSRTLRFFDRTEDIIHIDRYFNNNAQDSEQPCRSLALYGLAGIGKSSVALRYAETRIQGGELDAMLWVASEKEVTIRQSFTDIALRLGLPEAQVKDHDQNRTLVLQWLHDTKCRWLVIYDNAESVELLMRYWPTASRGQVVITTRNRNLAFHPCNGGLEVTEWDAETGSHFLLHLLSTNISAQLTAEEATSAHELSLNLSGHALALSLMAGLIHRRSWSIAEFVELYKNRPEKVHGIFGNDSINALWDISFRSLSDKTRAILGVMSFLAPDNIPQALFEPHNPEILPKSLEFCADPFDFFDEIDSLLTLALIKRNKEQRAFSVHRLVQTSFKAFLTPSDRQKSFNDATQLVSAAFPRKDSEFAQMYQLWKPCSLYLPHVLSLRDSFREEKKRNSAFSALMIYCDLNNACQRYLIETNGYNDLLDLVEVNAIAVKTIPPQSHTIQIDLEGSLASHRGQVLARVGRATEGVNQLKLAYDLFSTDQPRNLREEAWCAENLADGIASTNQFDKAVEWQEKARDHWLEWAKENSEDKTEWPAILKWGMGTNLVWAGQKLRARDILTQALSQLEAAKPYNWAMAAYTHFSLGTVDRFDRELKAAEAHFTEAHNKWISGDNLRSDPFSGACVYRMGCVALDQGRVETSIKHLREASVITERHKERMPAEHARTLFKLSEALTKDPRCKEESTRVRHEADNLLLSCFPQVKETGCEKVYDDFVFIWWR